MERKQLIRIFIITIIISFLISVFTISFAYFYSQAKGKKGVNAESAKLGLSLNVKRVTTDKTIGMLPLDDSDVKKAVEEKTYGSCIDSKSKGRCQVYEIQVTNTGNVTAVVEGKLQLVADKKSKFTNLKWMEISGKDNATPFGSIKTMKDTTFKTNYAMGAGASTTFYIVIWISNTEYPQNSEDNGSFTGTISFESYAGVSSNATISG